MTQNGLASLLAGFILAIAMFLSLPSPAAATVTIYPAPAGEPLSGAYKMQVGGRDVPVYQLKVAPEDKTLRLNAVDDMTQNGINFEPAAFAYFDSDGPVTVTVTFNGPVTAARLLPLTPSIPVRVQGNTIQFNVNGPQNLTLEVNRQIVRTLHIFVNPMETGAPSPQDPKVFYFQPGAHPMSSLRLPAGKSVFYFGPGVHTIDNLVVHDGQTVYIAGGAVVQGVIREGEKSSQSTYNTTLYAEPVIKLYGSNISLRGRGIIDGSPSLGKRLITIQGQNITLEGVILKNSGSWFMPIYYSDRVTASNVKILGYRANTDGIDVYNSRDVTIQGCFIRTVDDVIVIKSRPMSNTPGDGEVKNITVNDNRLWNETGSAMRIGTEVGVDISTVTFSNNDVIRDIARGSTESIFLAGSGTVSNIRYENNRIDRTGNPYDRNGQSRVISLYIRHSLWEAAADKTATLGKIRGVLFSNNIVTTSQQNPQMLVELLGASPQSDIEAVKFENITVNGKPLSRSNLAVSEKFASQIVGLP